MTERPPTSCRSCGASVVFRTHPKTQKTSPYNNPPENCPNCDGFGWVEMEGVMCTGCEGSGKKWISHFATCPEAKKWRRK